MRVRKFKIESGFRTYNVVAENYTSTAEVISVTRAKPEPSGWKLKDDFCREDWTGVCRLDRYWYGVADQKEFEHLVKLGVDDTSVVTNIRKYAMKATVEDKDRYVQTCMDVAGGGVDVPRVLTGNPQCMYSMKRKKVKSRIINIGLECGLTCDYTVEQYRKVGMAFTKVMAKLEKAGYRTSLTTMAAFYDREGTISVMTNIVKRENAPMNYARIMFPLTSIAYFRCLGFGWVVRAKSYKGGSSLGPHISSCFTNDEAPEKVDELFKRSVGNNNFMGFMMKQMVGICDRQGQDALERYIEAKLMDMEAM